MKHQTRLAALSAAAILTAAGAVGCGSSSAGSSSGPGSSSTSITNTAKTSPSGGSTASASALGTPHKATRTPYVFGLINDESGAITAPEVREAAQAGAAYVNNYLDGINGHPIKLDTCVSDGTPASSTNCANQIVAKHPVLIVGGADTGASGAFPVWNRQKLDYVGGPPLTPVESNAPNSFLFIGLQIPDNAAAVEYAKKHWDVKKASIIYTNDTQGLYTADIIKSEMQSAGINASLVPVTPTQPDMSSAAASAISSNPQLVYDETPTQCASVLTALHAVGYTGHLGGIDPCSSPQTIAAAGSAANGLIFAQPYHSLDGATTQETLAAAILQKYAPKNIAITTGSLSGLSALINIRNMLQHVARRPSTKAITAALTTGASHPNFLAHPYTCTRKQVPGESASCDPWMLIKQVENGKVTTTPGWVNAAHLYTPPSK